MSPLRKAGASRKIGTRGECEGFRMTPRRIPAAVVVVEWRSGNSRRKRRDRRPIRSDNGCGRAGLQKAILSFDGEKRVMGYN